MKWKIQDTEFEGTPQEYKETIKENKNVTLYPVIRKKKHRKQGRYMKAVIKQAKRYKDKGYSWNESLSRAHEKVNREMRP